MSLAPVAEPEINKKSPAVRRLPGIMFLVSLVYAPTSLLERLNFNGRRNDVRWRYCSLDEPSMLRCRCYFTVPN